MAVSAENPTLRGATKPALTSDVAVAAAASAGTTATEAGTPAIIAVVDDAGALNASLRMDGALNAASGWVIDKGFTAAAGDRLALGENVVGGSGTGGGTPGQNLAGGVDDAAALRTPSSAGSPPVLAPNRATQP